jgi:hypothetical protein
MVTRVPAIPSSFRPFAVPGLHLHSRDANELYRDLAKVRDGYNEEEAKRELEVETKVRSVIYSRAPTWHKFNVIAGRPKLIHGKAIAVTTAASPR